jgi:heterodisulfide reductase subunit B
MNATNATGSVGRPVNQPRDPQVITRRHVKPIPDDGYYFTTSCVMGTFSPQVEPLMTRIYDLLGRRWAMGGEGAASLNTCCSGIVTHGNVFTIESSLLVVARLWSVCAEAGFDSVTTMCVTSFAIHNEMLELLHTEPGLAEKVDKALYDACGRRLVLPEHVVHCSDIVYLYRQELAKLMKYRLADKRTGRPLKVVDHVGCHYNKIFPRKAIGGMEYCDVLTAMIREWGGDEVDYPERRHCCGMGFRQCMIRPNRSFTVACARKKFESMAPFEPDLILVNCPGCGLVLDREQWAVGELTGTDYKIPVLNYAELAGLLLGWDPYDVVGVQGHTTPVEPLLDRIGIPQSSRPAYLHNGTEVPTALPLSGREAWLAVGSGAK